MLIEYMGRHKYGTTAMVRKHTRSTRQHPLIVLGTYAQEKGVESGGVNLGLE
jgi:hypothetical protein